MPFNGSGTFTRIHSWVTDAAAGIKIRADRSDEEAQNFADGLSACITKSGQTTITNDLPMAGFKHTGVGNATARTQYASMAQVQDQGGVYVATVAGTADAITLTPSPAITAYAAGQRFSFVATGTNTTAVTVAISGLATRAVTKFGATALVAGDITTGDLVTIQDDGTRCQLLSSVRTPVFTAGSIATAALADNAVTLAKLEDGTQGDILYYGASGAPARLGFGTSGQFLKTQGTGANPVWADVALSGSEVLIATYTPSAAASQAVTGFNASLYTDYRIVLDHVLPATSAVVLYLRTSTDGGSNYDSGASDYRWVADGALGTVQGLTAGDTADNIIAITGAVIGDVGNSAGDGISGEIKIVNPGAAAKCRVLWHVALNTAAGNWVNTQGSGCRDTAANVDAVQLLFSSGNIASGTIRFYGRRV